jgi:signal transduction histidine kinase
MLASIEKAPQIQLIEAIADNQPYVFNLSERKNFKYSTHNLVFKWTVTDLNSPLNNQYFYQLKGMDKEWHSVGKMGLVEFASLSPGDYTLLLKGANSNGVYADKILQLQFSIQPPFWRTWWFFSFLICLIGAFFYSLYRYRINQLIKIETLRNKISLDLHDDIGSTLSSISILSDMALRNTKNDERQEMIREIKYNSVSLMDTMDDIVWSINPRNDSLESLFERIRSFAARLFEAKGINYTIEIDENIKQVHIMMEDRRHLYLIMKEAINNLVKYSVCTEAYIQVSYSDNLLTILISDNGKGFDTNIASQGNGLAGMKKRAGEMKADLLIKSTMNMGTQITVTIKIK